MWLVGMMGSGKSVAGRIAATRLGIPFADTDDEVERAAGKSLADIWAEDGEQRFRRLEVKAVDGLAGFGGLVATGGGAVLAESNRRVMAAGTVVWLSASPRVLATRAARARRPLLEGGDPEEILRALLASREAAYREVADHEIDTEGMTVEDVARGIEALWRG